MKNSRDTKQNNNRSNRKIIELREGLINSIQIEDLNNNQKTKMLQIALQYTIPRLQASLITTEREDLPLFIEDIQKF